MDLRPLDLIDGKDQAAIVQEQGVAPGHIVGQCLIGNPYPLFRTLVASKRGIEDESITLRQSDLVIFESLDTNLRAL